LGRLYRRKSGVDPIIGYELGVTLCQISRQIGRQAGLLLDRRGRVERVIIGTPSEIFIPDLTRARAGPGRLRGLRLVHTHLKNEPLSRDDLTDLALLRLDMVSAIGVAPGGEPMTIYSAHVSAENQAGPAWTLIDPAPFSKTSFRFPEFISDLESEVASGDRRIVQSGEGKAILAHISNLPEMEVTARMDELTELARTERIVAVDQVIYRGAAHPKSLVGSGRLKDLIIRSMSQGADMILFDNEMSPAQSRWIGKLAEIPVLDRTQLILRIFARRAFSKEGKLKVELAKLKYELPRVGAKDDSLSRIRGGIGVRGPGETTMEITGRRIKERIKKLSDSLEKLSRGRTQRRSLRKRSGVPHMAVIGYTNAGKSTLLNAMTNSKVLVEDKLFATLDPATRRVRFPENSDVVISDTVGFIRDLPDELLGAFRSTLEELNDADLLLHIVDISSPGFKREIETVEKILSGLGLDMIPRKLVFNKIDKIDPEMAANEAVRYNATGISALTGEGLACLVSEAREELTQTKAGRGDKPGKAGGAVSGPG